MFSGLKVLTKRGITSADLPPYYEYVVVPIPLAKKRLAGRGFNQALVIAQVLANKFDLKVQGNILERCKETKPQYDLGKKERTVNMDSAFKVRTDVTGKSFLLVDDICTSGSTFISASKALYDAGALHVECFALSKKL